MITKRRGPAPTGKGTLIGVRFHGPQLAALDAWCAGQPDAPTRPEAVRRLIRESLLGKDVARQILDNVPDKQE